MAAGGSASDARKKGWKLWLRRCVILGVIVLVPRLFFQLHEVQGPSMWPAFNDGVEREWVLSLRPWLAGEPEVYDVVVVSDPERPDGRVVKRVAAMPGEYVNIIDGDVRVRSRDLKNEWWLKRSLDQIIATRVPFFHLKDLSLQTVNDRPEIRNERHRCIVPEQGSCSLDEVGGFLKLEPDRGLCVLRAPAGQVMDDHMTTTGHMTSGRHVVRDVVVTLTLYEPTSMKTGVVFEVQHWTSADPARPHFALRLDHEGPGARLSLLEKGRSRFQGHLDWQDQRTLRLVLVDDRVAVLASERGEPGTFQVVYEGHRKVPPRATESYLKLVARGGSVVLSRLDMDRDIHYTPATEWAGTQDSAHVLTDSRGENGQLFLLGDNSPQSRDSRHWRRGAPQQVLGRPILVVWPWSRMRVLP